MGFKETVASVARRVGLNADHRTFKDVEEKFLEHHPHGDPDYLAAAYELAEKAHRGQTRCSNEPYINHPVAVAYILAEQKLDVDTVAAGFLHDVVEDCQVDTADLKKQFGLSLAQIVDGVTKIGKVRFRDKTHAQAENYRKMILAISKDIRVLIVKLADRYHNMQTLEFLSPEKRKRISQETLEIYSPLAHRIGMTHFKNEMERLAFLYLEPDAYALLEKALSEREKRNRAFLAKTSEELSQLLEVNQVKAEVSSRIKGHYSIHRKMMRKNCTLEGLYDYFAFRIITDTVENCYKIFGLLHGKWRHIPGRIKDFIATPKSNLYQSIHTTLISPDGQPFEVQVRTQMMHRIAEEGVAAHWTYKNGKLLSVGRNDFVAWLKKVADDQREVHDTDEFLDAIKGQFQAREILVFTPMSEIKTLPQGSTPLDFAYLIHTEVGHCAVAAKVDGKMVPLRSELQSGSIVEIITSNRQTPREEWLTIVKTPSARAKIRAWLRAEERVKAVEMGRTLFEKELKENKISLKKVPNSLIQSKLSLFHKKKIEDFYSAIGFGSLTPKKAVKPFLPKELQEKKDPVAFRENRLRRAIQKITRKSDQLVRVRGHNDLLVNLAKCCNPILGDPIIGYITQGRGISVHKKDCRSFINQNLNPERKMAVAWDTKAETQVFNVHIRVYTEDRAGMIADISNAIANTKTNVPNLRAISNEEKGMGIFDIVLQIHTLDHLTKVVQQLKKVKGFLNYERVN